MAIKFDHKKASRSKTNTVLKDSNCSKVIATGEFDSVNRYTKSMESRRPKQKIKDADTESIDYLSGEVVDYDQYKKSVQRRIDLEQKFALNSSEEEVFEQIDKAVEFLKNISKDNKVICLVKFNDKTHYAKKVIDVFDAAIRRNCGNPDLFKDVPPKYSYVEISSKDFFDKKKTDIEKAFVVKTSESVITFRNAENIGTYFKKLVREGKLDSLTNWYIVNHNFPADQVFVDYIDDENKNDDEKMKKVLFTYNAVYMNRHESNVKSVDFVAVDCDSKVGYLKNSHYKYDATRIKKNEQNARALSEFGANIIVMSHNGPQGYFVFDKRYYINDSGSADSMTLQQFKDFVSILHRTVGKFATPDVDMSCQSVSQIMRMPGTLHYKDDNTCVDQVEAREFKGEKKSPNQWIREFYKMYKKVNDKVGMMECKLFLGRYYPDEKLSIHARACKKLKISQIDNEHRNLPLIRYLRKNNISGVKKELSKLGIKVVNGKKTVTVPELTSLINKAAHPEELFDSVSGEEHEPWSKNAYKDGSFSFRANWFRGDSGDVIVRELYDNKTYHSFCSLLCEASGKTKHELLVIVAKALNVQVVAQSSSENAQFMIDIFDVYIQYCKEILRQAQKVENKERVQFCKMATRVFDVMKEFVIRTAFSEVNQKLELGCVQMNKQFLQDICESIIHKNSMIYNKFCAKRFIRMLSGMGIAKRYRTSKSHYMCFRLIPKEEFEQAMNEMLEGIKEINKDKHRTVYLFKSHFSDSEVEKYWGKKFRDRLQISLNVVEVRKFATRYDKVLNTYIEFEKLDMSQYSDSEEDEVRKYVDIAEKYFKSVKETIKCGNEEEEFKSGLFKLCVRRYKEEKVWQLGRYYHVSEFLLKKFEKDVDKVTNKYFYELRDSYLNSLAA